MDGRYVQLQSKVWNSANKRILCCASLVVSHLIGVVNHSRQTSVLISDCDLLKRLLLEGRETYDAFDDRLKALVPLRPIEESPIRLRDKRVSQLPAKVCVNS